MIGRLLGRFCGYERVGRIKYRLKFSSPFFFNHYHRQFPKYIQIQTSSYCNASCIFCPYQDVVKKLPQGKMEWELFKKIIDECAKHKDKVHQIIPFLMNEPLIDKDIIKCIKYIKRYGFYVNLATNASNLTPDISQKLIDYGVDIVIINMPSIDEDEYHKNVPNIKFQRVMENINNFVECTHDTQNMERIIQINRTNETDEELLLKSVKYWEDKGVRVKIRYIMDRAGILQRFPQNIRISHLKGCRTNRHLYWFHILFNGDVILCCQDWERKHILGNVKEKSIYEVFHSKEYFHIRKQIEGLEKFSDLICTKCEFGIDGKA